MVSQESMVNNMYQCLIAVSMQHVPVIIFTYLFINMYIISVTETFKSYAYLRFPE